MPTRAANYCKLAAEAVPQESELGFAGQQMLEGVVEGYRWDLFVFCV